VSFDQTIAATTAHPLPPDLPITVISAGEFDSGSGPDADTVAVAFRAAQDDLARLPGAQHVIAARSGHNVMVTEPDIIVRAVETQLCALDRTPCPPPPAPRPPLVPG
jgi:pimeloyl-ACP methyl ester carboxylesterase